VSEEIGLPVRWGPNANIRWKADLPGQGVSSPVVAGGRVYVTACSGAWQHRLHVLCFNQADGRRLWERQFWATGSTLCNPKTNMAAPTPVSDGERVYALFATGDLGALDAQGNLLWYRALGRDYPTLGNNVGMAASPILWKDTLILPMDNPGESFAAGLDKFTGRNRWKVERDRGLNWVTPLLFQRGDRTEMLLPFANAATAYNPQTGEKLWSYETDGLSGIATPTTDGRLLLLPGSGAWLLALRPSEEEGKPELVWKSNKFNHGYASPVSYRDRVYNVTGANMVSCANGNDGTLVWQSRRLQGPFSASPVVADGKLYLVNEEGLTTVLQLGTKPLVLATNALNEPMLATPALAGGAIFLRSNAHLFCIAEKTATEGK
jgi:outer membrane protein assembly factor BamB